MTAPTGGAHVVVRDGAGEIVFKGNLAVGETRELKAVAARCACSPPTVPSPSRSTARTPAPSASPASPGQGTYVAD